MRIKTVKTQRQGEDRDSKKTAGKVTIETADKVRLGTVKRQQTR